MNAATHIVHKFYDYEHNTKGISFIGRPFPLNEADEHFARLRAWGLTFMRLLVTWEAVEHAGPGQYDEEYLSYLLQLVRRAKSFGISVFIDPHQDVFSRWTGGDGAPVWTLDAVGFNISALHNSGAAYSHQGHILAKGHHAPLPMMIWYTRRHTLTHSRMHVSGRAGGTPLTGHAAERVAVAALLGRGEVHLDHLGLILARQTPPVDRRRLRERAWALQPRRGASGGVASSGARRC